jgi:hypothetical protein
MMLIYRSVQASGSHLLLVSGAGAGTADWLAAGASVSATLIALGAAVIAARALADQRQGRRTEQRLFMFRRVVLDMALEALPRFAISTSEKLAAGQGDVEGKKPMLMHEALIGETKVLIGLFDHAYYELRMTMRAGLQAWPDAEFRRTVVEELETMQNRVHEAIHQLALDKPAPQLGNLVVDGAGRVLQHFVAYEIPESAKNARRKG